MTRIWPLLVLASALLSACGRGRKDDKTQDPFVQVFSLDTIPVFTLRIDDEYIESLKSAPRQWVKGAFTYEGKTYPEVGVRLKGHRSMRPIGKKSAFKINFGKYARKQRFFGRKRLTLNNMVEDPTKMREIFAYRLYRAMGVPAPNVGYVELVVNDDSYGVYALVETVDKTFFRARELSTSGKLYEGEYGCDLSESDVAGFDQDMGSGDRDDLRDLARLVGRGDIQAVFRLVDRDAFLSFMAVSLFIGDFDGYQHGHNYRLFFDDALEKWYFIPWGLDRVFKKHLGITDSEGLLAKLCFRDHTCRADYIRKMRQVIEASQQLDFGQAIAVIAAHIDERVAKDPKRPHTGKAIRKARERLLSFVRQRAARLESQLSCIGSDGRLIDADGDGYSCLDCDDTRADVHPGAVEACNSRDDNCSGLVDDAVSCPCNSVVVGGTTYELCNLPMPWQESSDYCAAKGMQLAVIPNESAARQLFAEATALRKERWWIGLSDQQREGTFLTPGGTVPAFTNWTRGEPDNDGCNQDCVALKEKANGRFHDTHCGQHRAFICSPR